MNDKLTHFQELFCRAYIKCAGNASAAYRAVSPKSLKWMDKTVWERASAMMARSKVKARIAELKEKGSQAALVTLQSLGAELDKGIVQAFQTENTSAYITGVMGKAKLFGFLVDKAEIRTGSLDNLDFEQLKNIDDLVSATITSRQPIESDGADKTTH